MPALLQYLDPPFDTGVKKNRTNVGFGDTLLVVETTDVQGVFEGSKEAGANIAARPRTGRCRASTLARRS